MNDGRGEIEAYVLLFGSKQNQKPSLQKESEVMVKFTIGEEKQTETRKTDIQGRKFERAVLLMRQRKNQIRD